MLTPKALVLALAAGASIATAASGAEPVESSHRLVQDVVYNEMHDHEKHGYWEYFIQKRVGQQTVTQEQIETREGPIHRLLTSGGVPLNPLERQQEEERLNQILRDPDQQRKLKEQYAEDEKRIGRIMNLLSDAFLYEYDGADGEDVRLTFRPNPGFHPQSCEARVFHAMSGTIWISREKRLSRLTGRLIENIDFGYGLLGRLYKGGFFNLERVQVSATDWKTHVLDVHITGKAILFKTIAKDTHEVRSQFREVPRSTTVAEAKNLLDEREVRFGTRQAGKQPALVLTSVR